MPFKMTQWCRKVKTNRMIEEWYVQNINVVLFQIYQLYIPSYQQTQRNQHKKCILFQWDGYRRTLFLKSYYYTVVYKYSFICNYVNIIKKKTRFPFFPIIVLQFFFNFMIYNRQEIDTIRAEIFNVYMYLFFFRSRTITWLLVMLNEDFNVWSQATRGMQGQKSLLCK